ncbi:MAG: glycosyltransferase family 4 protein [Gemmatimonadota bacterium]
MQLSLFADPQQRDGAALLHAWPLLPAMAAATARAGIDVTVVQTAHRSEMIERDGVPFHFVAGAHREWSRVMDIVSLLRPDVVHVQGLNFPRAMRPLSRAVRGAPIVVQDRGNQLPSGWRVAAWRWAHGVLAGATFTSRDQAIPWKNARILREKLPIFEVLSGSSDFAVGDRDTARQLTGMFGDPCLFWCGRLDANKDPMMMLSAVEHAVKALPGLQLWCCFGEAPLLEQVQARIASSTLLKDRVTLLGTRPRDEIELRARSADFFVQTSHREGGSLALLEAIAAGATPLVTDIPSARRIVGDAGSLTPVGDAPALGNAIIQWASRDKAALRVVVRARFDDALTYDAIGRQLGDAYAALVR